MNHILYLSFKVRVDHKFYRKRFVIIMSKNKFHEYMLTIEKFSKENQYDKAICCLKKAQKLENLNQYQRWMLKIEQYSIETQFNFEFNGFDSHNPGRKSQEMTKELVALREQALKFPDNMRKTFSYFYMGLLRIILLRNHRNTEAVETYEEIALEFYSLTGEKLKEAERSVSYYEKKGITNQDCIEQEAGIKLLYTIACNFLGRYYTDAGCLPVAEKYFSDILSTVNENEELSAAQFYGLSRLMLIHRLQGRTEQACELGSFLYEKLINSEVSDVYQGDVQKFVTYYMGVCEESKSLSEAISVMEYCISHHIIYHFREDDDMWLIYLIYMMNIVNSNDRISRYRLAGIHKIYKEYGKLSYFDRLASWQRSNYYKGLYYIHLLKGKNDAIEYLRKSLDILFDSDIEGVDKTSYFSSIYATYVEYDRRQDYDAIYQCAVNVMKQLIVLCSNAGHYIEDDMLDKYLSDCNVGFKMAYSALFNMSPAEARFEYSMNYKNIITSVVRERNHNVFKSEELNRLVNRIDFFKTQLENLKTGSYAGLERTIQCSDERQTECMKKRLKECETEFAKRYKENSKLKYFRLEELQNQLQDNTVVIDYIYVDRNIWKSGKMYVEDVSENVCVNISCARKKDKLYVKDKVVENVRGLRQLISEWMAVTDNPDKKPDKRNKIIAAKLYDILFGGFEDMLEDTKQIIICPNRELCNIPLELILQVGKKEFEGKQAVYCQSIRDIMECGKTNHGRALSPMCIVGSPKYNIGQSDSESHRDYDRKTYENQIISLPFSEFEVERIAQMFGVTCHTGDKATKYRIQSGFRYIHIATHGFSSADNIEKNAWYKSVLLFSGVVDFTNTGKESETYGNGLLSAAEISKMNLSGTELVVLSACNSGNSKFSVLEQQTGLHIAFGAAGVKYVISALWRIDDLAAALFMYYFYAHIKEGKDIPVSLQEAKSDLKNMSVSNMKSIIKEQVIQSKKDIFADIYSKLGDYPENYKIYHHWTYWAGFVCYQYIW